MDLTSRPLQGFVVTNRADQGTGMHIHHSNWCQMTTLPTPHGVRNPEYVRAYTKRLRDADVRAQ